MLATPTAATALAVTGCLIAGVPFVPVPGDVGAAERAHILTDSGVRAWLGERPDDLAGLPHIPVRLHARSWHSYGDPSPDSPAYVMYTSGTTERPRGCRRADAPSPPTSTHWHGLAVDTRRHPRARPAVVPRARSGAWSARIAAIGNRFVHTGKPTPQAYAQAGAAGGTLFFGVPTVWSRLAADAGAAQVLSSARLLVSGSAALPVPVFDALVGLTGHAPVERYGSTESLITLSTLADGERRAGWVGPAAERCRDPSGGRHRRRRCP